MSTTSDMTESHGFGSSRPLTADSTLPACSCISPGERTPWKANVTSEYTSASITTLANAALPGLLAGSVVSSFT